MAGVQTGPFPNSSQKSQGSRNCLLFDGGVMVMTDDSYVNLSLA